MMERRPSLSHFLFPVAAFMAAGLFWAGWSVLLLDRRSTLRKAAGLALLGSGFAVIAAAVRFG
jgi:hypothetical protein